MAAIRRQFVVPSSIEIELAKHAKLILAEAGLAAPEAVRRVALWGVADTRIAKLVLPEIAVRKLDLAFSGAVRFNCADARRRECPIARGVNLAYGGREGVYNAIVDPSGEIALIGFIVLQDLDLLIDPASGRLVLRDLEQITVEIG